MRNLVLFVVLIAASPAFSQAPDAEKLLQTKREKLKPLAFMDGVWRGPAWTLTPGGKQNITQTERIGSLLGGTVKLIEGRGYDADGKTVFNALGVLSWDAEKGKLMMRSYAMGRQGDYEFKVTDDGYVWEIKAGPATIRYTATHKGDTLTEVGERILPGQKPFQFFEMKLKRVGDSQWPKGKPVPPKGEE